MAAIHYSAEAREVCENFLSFFPAAGRNSARAKLAHAVEYELHKKQRGQATKDTVLDAIEHAFPPSFEPVTLRLRDPEAFMRLAAAQKEINPEHAMVRVRRWDIPAAKPGRPLKNVLALLAGPRKGGNTDCILDAMLAGVREAGCTVEKLYFSDLAIAPCSGCIACEKKELATYCAIQDDMTGIYRKFLEYDGFVLGFPIYTARECSQAAVFFDRLKALRTKGHISKLEKIRKGALAVTWGWPSDTAYSHVVENAAFILKLFGVEITQVVTGCGFWQAYYPHGTANMDTRGMAAARQAGGAFAAG